MLGTIIDRRYKIISQLGYGYYGETYLAQDTRRMGRQCVIKRLQAASSNSKEIQDTKGFFESEARILESLGREHDQIPDLIDYFEANQEFYLVQELIEGYPLSAVLSTGQRLPEIEVIDILLGVLGVLSFVHRCQVIHRDIKPSNLMRRYKDGKIVLIDFGAVKQVRTNLFEAQGRITVTRVIGTPGYMPIEQAKGKPRFCSDIYALGMTAIEALTGVPPSQLAENNLGEVIWQQQAQVTPELAAIIEKMVRPQVSDRYQSADEVLRDLQKLPITDSSPQPRAWFFISKRQRTTPKTILLASSAILLFSLCLTQIFAYFRFGVFPAKLIPVINSLPSSFYLQNSLNGATSDVHPVPISLTGNNFANFNSVAISPDGQIIASGSGDGAIKLRNANTGKLLRLLTGHSGHVHSVAISPDGEFLVSGSGDGTIKLWNLNLGKLIRTFSGNLNHVNTVAISANGQIIASGSSDRTVRLWNLHTGKLLYTLTGHTADVNTVAMNSCTNNPLLASSGGDGTIALWNPSTGRLIRTITGAGNVFSIAISPCTSNNQQVIASGNDNGTIALWNQNTGKLIRTIAAHPNVVTSIAISPDGKTLVSNSSDQIVKLWSLEGQLRRTLLGYIATDLEYINSVAFSSNGQTLISGTGEGTINFWQVN